MTKEKKKPKNEFEEKDEMNKALRTLAARWKTPVIIAEQKKQKPRG